MPDKEVKTYEDELRRMQDIYDQHTVEGYTTAEGVACLVEIIRQVPDTDKASVMSEFESRLRKENVA